MTSYPTSRTMPAISWPGTIGKIAGTPLFARLMDVGVADAGVGDVDQHVVRADIPAVDGAAFEGLAGGVNEKGGGGNGHERNPFTSPRRVRVEGY